MSDDEKKGKREPSVRVRSAGKVNNVMNMLGEKYRELVPDRDCRWVYAPIHKPELSNVMSRLAQGYVPVLIKDLPLAKGLMPGLKPSDEVRVGDTVLMSIEAEVREIFKEELHQDALEQGKRVEREYFDALEGESEEGSSGEAHKASGRGSFKLEEQEREYEYEQRTSEEGEEE
jgi:hypothetical protein